MTKITIDLTETMSIPLARDAGYIDIDVTKLSAEILEAALRHGLRQKFGDGANSETSLKAYAGKTVVERVQAKAEALRDQLYRGVWALKSGGGGPKLDDKAKWIRQEAIKAARVYIASGKYIINGKPMMKIADSEAVKTVSEKYLATPAWYARVEARYVPTVPDADIDPFA